MAIEDYIDVNNGLRRVSGKPRLYAKMLNLFLVGDEFNKFEEAMAEGDLTKASDVAHAIKGMTGNMAFTALFETSASLMVSLKNGERDEETLAKFRDAEVKTKEYAKQLIEKYTT
ncbi:MAG: Hpt domain-containing protein [Clostridiales bacterium]|nr:Hpt domain-containing protein [Clostridiales bacterium]